MQCAFTEYYALSWIQVIRPSLLCCTQFLLAQGHLDLFRIFLYVMFNSYWLRDIWTYLGFSLCYVQSLLAQGHLDLFRIHIFMLCLIRLSVGTPHHHFVTVLLIPHCAFACLHIINKRHRLDYNKQRLSPSRPDRLATRVRAQERTIIFTRVPVASVAKVTPRDQNDPLLNARSPIVSTANSVDEAPTGTSHSDCKGASLR